MTASKLVATPSVPSALGYLYERVRILEQVPSLHWGENEGGWFHAFAYDKSPESGVNWFVTAGTIAPGTSLASSTFPIIIFNAGRPDLSSPNREGILVFDGMDDDGNFCTLWVGKGLIAQDGVHPDYTSNGLVAWLHSTTQTFAVLGHQIIHVLEITGNYTAHWTLNDIVFYMVNTGAFEIQKTSGAPIFRIGQDGNVHILTTASVIADL